MTWNQISLQHKHLTSSWVCITVENSPNPSPFLYQARFILLKWWKFDLHQIVWCQSLLLLWLTILPLVNFARSPERVRNPHLRAKLAETLEALVPIQRSENSPGLLSGSQINMVFIMFIKEIDVLRFGHFQLMAV